jgi:hypothetical protein
VPADITLDPGISAIASLPAKLESTSGSSTSGPSPVPASPPNPAATTPKLANPQLTVDPSTARVVYEYFSDTGVLTNSIPSVQQLQAYRLAAQSGAGQKSAAVQSGGKP